MSDADLARLRALAEAATAGPWVAEECPGALTPGRFADCWHVAAPAGSVTGLDGEYGDGLCSESDALYISAVSPDVVLALLDRLAAVEAERDEARRLAARLRDAAERCGLGHEAHGPAWLREALAAVPREWS